MTLIFALFCAATGQLPKTASEKRAETEPTIFKGTVYRASDSTVLSNVRLYLQDCFLPEYGIYPDYGIYPEYGVIQPLYGVSARLPATTTNDEITTDDQGTFEIDYTGTSSFTRSIASEVVSEPDGNKTYYSQGCIDFRRGKDSTYTIYLRNTTTAAAPKTNTSVQPSVMTVFHGKELQIRMPEWNGQNSSASIVNTKGQKTATLTSDANGILHWDTRPVAKGVYFLRLQDAHSTMSMKILVK